VIQHAIQILLLEQEIDRLPVTLVDSIPTLVTPQDRSQSARASSSLRVVRKDRVSCWRRPAVVSLGTRTVTSIPALAISIPATRSANSGSSSMSCIG
jgi:hypothetical protein